MEVHLLKAGLMLKNLLRLFYQKSSLVLEREWWKQRAIVNQEHLEYWQGTADFYRKKWNEALAFLPAEKAKELTGNGEPPKQ